MGERVGTVLMTGDTVGGAWSYALELAAALAPLGVKVVLATMGEPTTEGQRQEARQLPNLTVVESRYRLEWMEDPWHDLERAGDWLLGLAEQVRPDLVHLNNFCHGALPFGRPVLMVGHACLLSWWRAVRGAAAPPSWQRYRQDVERGLRAASLVVAPTRSLLDSLAADYGPLPAATVIAHGRSAARFRPGRKLPLVLSVGRLWDEAKNLAVLEAAAPRLSWPVVVAGPLAAGLDLHVERPPRSDRSSRVRWLGRLSAAELVRQYAAAAIFALPARYEPFGLSVLEAALSGCALVLGDVPSLRELWSGAAELVPPDDVEQLAQAIERLAADPDRRARAGAAALARARTFAPERMAAAYLAAYRRLVEARKEAACA
jgi:glycosyltransferase involved in cell wall biosynthesis